MLVAQGFSQKFGSDYSENGICPYPHCVISKIWFSAPSDRCDHNGQLEEEPGFHTGILDRGPRGLCIWSACVRKKKEGYHTHFNYFP